MSALRLGRNPDGTRMVVVIDGGATGRLTHTRAAITGGALVVAGGKPIPRDLSVTTPQRRAQMAAYKAMLRNRCDHAMRSGELCARTKGHGNYHKGAKQMEIVALRRRAA